MLIAGTIAGTIICGCGLAGCSGSESSSAPSSAQGAAAVPAGPGAAPGAANAPAASFGFGGDSGSASSASGSAGSAQSSAAKLIPSPESIIYTAQLSVRVKGVSTALAQATRIVSAAGGYVASETASSDPDHPASASATITFKIPVAVYQQTLASLSGASVGTQLSLKQQAQDVTQQVADVDSQVTSDEDAIGQLRLLLKHAGSVGELLQVQDQINTEEGDLEAMEAQQRALNHEVSYATVTVTIVGPKAAAPKPKAKKTPPPGLVSGASGGWHAFTLTVDWLLAIIGAVAPFAAALAVLAALVWWVRRRLRRHPAATPVPDAAAGD
ncbi:MAG TPA: DUF4349 domain-containing protein [Trebonia sp.]|nr:DUF4349 domain-containing protein [Trebonia sp.]